MNDIAEVGMFSPPPYEIVLGCKRLRAEVCNIGDRVWWETLSGYIYVGELIDTDNGTAIVRLDNGEIKAC